MEHRTKEFAQETISAIFVELERFSKALEECASLLDKWCYAFRHIGWLKDRPENLEQEIFIKLFESAEIARFDKDKRLQYESEMYTERDKYAEDEYLKEVSFAKGEAKGREEGLAEGLAAGREEERVEIARKMKEAGMPVGQIAILTGLSEVTVEKLRSSVPSQETFGKS